MQKVFVDANVLYSRTLRDWLFNFRQPDLCMFEIYSSPDVFIEVLKHLRESHPDVPWDYLQHCCDQMQELVQSVTNYDPKQYASQYMGADPNDLHVHAAAMAAHCDYLLTDDRKLYGQLTETELDELEYEVITSDDFFCLVADSSPILMDQALTGQLDYWKTKHSNRTLAEFLLPLCPRFSLRVQRALMRKAGMPPKDIQLQCPLQEENSESSSTQYLLQINPA